MVNFAGPIVQLINLDSKTLIGVLVWGNLAMGIIIYLYESTSKYKFDFRSVIRNMATVRFLSALGYLCLFLRGEVPDVLSANIGNSLLYLCFYLESRMLLEITNLYTKRIHVLGTGLLILCIAAFNFMESVYRSASVRIGVASAIIFLLQAFPAAALLTSKNAGKFKKGVGIFYVPLLAALIPRCIEAFAGRIASIEANIYYQTLLFGSLALLMISNTIIYLLFVKEKADSVIQKMANYDDLTDVMNRHNFFATGKIVFEKHKERSLGLSVLFLDIDFFKSINDRFGHQFGDDVLVLFADTIKGNIRPTDMCCRYGGEEFVVLANVNEEGCKNMADRILHETEKITLESAPDFRMTTSIGCVTGIPKQDETLDDFIGKADKALYKAKNEGRNRIIFYTENYFPPQKQSGPVR